MSRLTRARKLLVIVSIVAPATAGAQVNHFGIGGSIAMPTGDYHSDYVGEGFNAGWQGLAFVDVTPSGSPFGLRVEGTYGRNHANDKLKADLMARGYADQATRLLGVCVDVTYDFRWWASVKPYLLAGIGLYNVGLSMTWSAGTRDTSVTTFGWSGGGGVRYDMGPAALFLEARYARLPRMLNSGRNYAGSFYHPFGIQVQQIGLTAGIRFALDRSRATFRP